MTEISPSEVVERGLVVYEKLRARLEAEHGGQAVALHVDTEDYAIGGTHSEALRRFWERHAPDGRVVTLTIGPSTEADADMAQRFLRGHKA